LSNIVKDTFGNPPDTEMPAGDDDAVEEEQQQDQEMESEVVEEQS
jgi:hypothetical protein